MVFRFLNTCCKLLQRRTYTCLSTRSGLWFCIGGLILLAISTLQFSEVLIEWSMQKYAHTFSPSHDNIAGKSFQNRLCLPTPIDMVYTWVNGSDPTLVQELIDVKLMLASELNKTRQNTESTNKMHNTGGINIGAGSKRSNAIDKFRWVDGSVCPFPNCAPFNAISIAVPANVSKQQLLLENNILRNFDFYQFKHHIDPGIRIIKFKEPKDYQLMFNKTLRLNGKKISFEIVFITSTITNGAEKLHGVNIINDVPEHFSKQTIDVALAAVNLFNTDINIIQNISILSFPDAQKAKRYLEPLKYQISISGKKFKVMPATLVWKPWTDIELGHQLPNEDISASRFADNDELKYSLRSVEKYAPWIRNIYIVTNGQIPSWLNLDHPRMKIVTHRELFVNESHLPTYSSPAIETHIHRIPGLSTKFIYMNDDVFFGDTVWPDDFYTHSKGQKIYLTWPVPNCNEGCPAAWINDKYCDKPCNVSECDWDGGDCLRSQGKQGWQFGSQSLTGRPYSTVGEYCNGGCANSWIGDRYCDANCNVKDCGFDAGDCGLDNFHLLHSFTGSTSKPKGSVPAGMKSFYINLTSWVNNGELTDGDYAEATVVRTAVFSKRYKILTVSLYANFTDTISFKVTGLQNNKTIVLGLNVTVDTRKTSAPPTSVPPTDQHNLIPPTTSPAASLKPFSLYDHNRKRSNQQSRLGLHKINKTVISLVYDFYQTHKKDLPLEPMQSLNQTELDWKAGDITIFGYKKRIYEILRDYIHVANESHISLINENVGVTKLKVGRHLTSFEETIQYNVRKKNEERKTNHKDTKSHLHQKHLKIKILNKQRPEPPENYLLSSPFRWERQKFFGDIISTMDRIARQEKYRTKRIPKRKLLDTFASSLLHVSRIYNRAFSYKARKVPAHIPHMVDIDVINEMQARFWPYFEATSSHKIRSPNDMQFAFSYFYYLMGLPASINMTQLFDDLDTDHSGLLSDRELRTLAATLFSLPLELKDVKNLETYLRNCSEASANASTAPQQRTELPRVTVDLLTSCKPIIELLQGEIKKKSRYKYEEVGDTDVTFKMIRNNVSQLVFQLDWIRKNKRKFVCLNDNIDHDNPQAKVVRTVLKDFYESMFPLQSQFELPKRLRNKFLNVDALNSWLRKEQQTQEWNTTIVYIFCAVIFVLIMRKRIYRFLQTILYWLELGDGEEN